MGSGVGARALEPAGGMAEAVPAALLRLSVVRNGLPAVLDWWVMLRIDRGRVTQAWGPFATEQGP